MELPSWRGARRRARLGRRSAPTWRPARCSRLTGAACSRCRSADGGPLGWWSPDPRGILPLDGLRVSALAAPFAPPVRRAGRHGVRRRDRRPAPTPPGHCGWITEPDAQRLPRAASTSAGRTASRPGTPTPARWPAGSTASRSAGCSRASRCSTTRPTRRRWRSLALVDGLRDDGSDGDGAAARRAMGERPTWCRSAAIELPRAAYQLRLEAAPRGAPAGARSFSRRAATAPRRCRRHQRSTAGTRRSRGPGRRRAAPAPRRVRTPRRRA